MTRSSVARIVAIDAALVVIWVLAWGDLSVANVLSGAVVGLLLLATFPVGRIPERQGRTFRLLPALLLLAYFLRNFLLSNVVMARDILGGGHRIRTGVVACPLRVDSDGIATFLANSLTLSPGTLVLEVDHAPPVLYLHVLHADERERILATVRRMEELAVRAYGNPAERTACGMPARSGART